jgi:hypothetical protein
MNDIWEHLQKKQRGSAANAGGLSRDANSVSFSIQTVQGSVGYRYFLPGLLWAESKEWKGTAEELAGSVTRVFYDFLAMWPSIVETVGKNVGFGICYAEGDSSPAESMLDSFRDFVGKAARNIRPWPTRREDLSEQYQVAGMVLRRTKQAKISLELFHRIVAPLDEKESDLALSQADFAMTFAESRLDRLRFTIENDVRNFDRKIQYILAVLTTAIVIFTVILILR